jgi:tetratricopeptide (TPR) repeat protein
VRHSAKPWPLPAMFNNSHNITNLATCFLLLVVVSSCAQTPKSDSKEFNDAYAIYQTDKVGCQTKLLQYTKKYPNDYKGWSLLGSVSVELNSDSLANTYLDKALRLNPKDVMALTELGVIERKRKNYDKAANYYEKAIAIDPAYGRAYASLMLIELKRANYQKAVALGEKGTALEPDALYMKAQLSLAYHFNKQFDKRDALIKELTEKGYPYVENYKKAFSGEVTLDDL